MARLIELEGEVSGIEKSMEMDTVILSMHPKDSKCHASKPMSFQIEHEDGNEGMFRSPVDMTIRVGDD